MSKDPNVGPKIGLDYARLSGHETKSKIFPFPPPVLVVGIAILLLVEESEESFLPSLFGLQKFVI